MSNLSGHAISAFIGSISTKLSKWPDHTYVLSDDGYKWGCPDFGRSSGGRQICSGLGDSSQADCISQENSKAGIKYFAEGVCHQMANRILYPAKQIVSKARGYRLSEFLYGTYGRNTNDWLDRISRCTQPAPPAPPAPLGSGGPESGSPLDSQENAYLTSILKLYSQESLMKSGLDEQKLSATELELTVRYRLGEKVSVKTIGALQEVRHGFQNQCDAVHQMFLSKEIESMAIVRIIDQQCAQAQNELYKILGDDDFKKMFDFVYSEEMPMHILDPNIVAKEYGSDEDENESDASGGYMIEE